MAMPQPQPRWARWFGVVVTLSLVGLVAWSAWPRWSTTSIELAEVSDERITVHATWCNARGVRTSVEESEDSVTLTVSLYDENSPNRDDCADPSLTVVLDSPLGERALIDGATDRPLRCEPPGPTRRECVP